MSFEDLQEPVVMVMDEGLECFEKTNPRFGADVVALGMLARRPVAILDHYGSSDVMSLPLDGLDLMDVDKSVVATAVGKKTAYRSDQ
jgi:hypothetical protein